MPKPLEKLFSHHQLQHVERKLTKRELEIARHHADGKASEEIGLLLKPKLNSNAVDAQLAKILSKIRHAQRPKGPLLSVAKRHGVTTDQLSMALAVSIVRESVGNQHAEVVSTLLSGGRYDQTPNTHLVNQAVYRLSRLVGVGKNAGPTVEHDEIKRATGSDLLRLVLFHPHPRMNADDWNLSTRTFNQLRRNKSSGFGKSFSWNDVKRIAEKGSHPEIDLGPSMMEHLALKARHIAGK